MCKVSPPAKLELLQGHLRYPNQQWQLSTFVYQHCFGWIVLFFFPPPHLFPAIVSGSDCFTGQSPGTRWAPRAHCSFIFRTQFSTSSLNGLSTLEGFHLVSETFPLFKPLFGTINLGFHLFLNLFNCHFDTSIFGKETLNIGIHLANVNQYRMRFSSRYRVIALFPRRNFRVLATRQHLGMGNFFFHAIDQALYLHSTFFSNFA